MADMMLSTDGQLKSDIPLKPSFRPQHLETMVTEVRSQIDLLVDDQRIDMSLVTLCLYKILTALVKLALQMGLQFHLGVALVHCVMQSLWTRALPTGAQARELVGAALLIPSRIIWGWMPNS